MGHTGRRTKERQKKVQQLQMTHCWEILPSCLVTIAPRPSHSSTGSAAARSAASASVPDASSSSSSFRTPTGRSSRGAFAPTVTRKWLSLSKLKLCTVESSYRSSWNEPRLFEARASESKLHWAWACQGLFNSLPHLNYFEPWIKLYFAQDHITLLGIWRAFRKDKKASLKTFCRIVSCVMYLYRAWAIEHELVPALLVTDFV